MTAIWPFYIVFIFVASLQTARDNLLKQECHAPAAAGSPRGRARPYFCRFAPSRQRHLLEERVSHAPEALDGNKS
jgi:hypothetical protein